MLWDKKKKTSCQSVSKTYWWMSYLQYFILLKKICSNKINIGKGIQDTHTVSLDLGGIHCELVIMMAEIWFWKKKDFMC